MKYIIYLTLNKKVRINGKPYMYMGVHKVENPLMFDGYLGCGVYAQQNNTFMYPKSPLACAVKRFGVASFERITLYEYDTLEEANKKLVQMLTQDFLGYENVYNYTLGKIIEKMSVPLYQFDLKGNLRKTWETMQDAEDFYGYSTFKFFNSVQAKRNFLGSFWSTSKNININEYNTKHLPCYVYIFNKYGMLTKEFDTKESCAKYLGCSVTDIKEAIKQMRMISGYYVSNKMVDVFKPHVRRNYKFQTFYLYKNTGEFVGTYKGKEIMRAIKLHSWLKIGRIFSMFSGFYEDFYLSLEKVDKIPEKPKRQKFIIEVYDKYGKFIEKTDNLKEVKEKYKIPNSKLKDIQEGNKYFGDYIFKYSK